MKCWMLDDDITTEYDELPSNPWCHAATRNDARSIFAGEFDYPYLWTKAYRFPAGDDIRITPAIALYIGIYDWHGCFRSGCDRHIYGDAADMNGLYSYNLHDGTVQRAAVDWRGRVYCSAACADASGSDGKERTTTDGDMQWLT